MMVLGVDVGGTKTHCAVADVEGNILAQAFAGPGNYQTCGEEKAYQSMSHAVNQAVELAGISLDQISYAVFGIAGADGPEDFEILIPMVKRIMGKVPFRVVHDSWIGLRAGTGEENRGVVSICGTGAGHAGRNEKGETLTLRNLDYIMGNYGGGEELVEAALHYAFRSEEGTGDKSELETKVPEIFGVSNMEQVCGILRRQEMTEAQRFQLPIAVFELAKQGDGVCRELISRMGYEEGRYAAGVLQRLHMCEGKVPAVLIGSLFKTGEPLLIDSYMEAVRKVAPKAYPVILQEAPVVGAIGLALDEIRNEGWHGKA